MFLCRINLRSVFAIAIVSLIITACGQRAPLEKEPTATHAPAVMIPAITVTVSNTPTQERSAAPLPTATEAPTHDASPSPAGNPLEELRDNIPSCTNNGRATDADLVEGFRINGTILYHRNDPLGLHAISGDINNPAKIELPGPRNYEYFGVSPNGKWLAVTPFEPDEKLNKDQENWPILLISNTGQRKEISVDLANVTAYAQSIDNEHHFIYIQGRWLNDDALELYVAYAFNRWQVRPISIHAYFNPFTGEWLEGKQIPEFGPYQWIDLNCTSVSPDMSRALYLTKGAITIWDFQKQQVLKTWEDLGVKVYPYYSWSPDSQWAIFYSDDLKTMLIDRNGETIIDLNQELQVNRDAFLYAYEGSWSPDSRFLGIYARGWEGNTVPNGSDHWVVLIFDLKKKQYVFQCEIHDNHDYPYIQWSPDTAYVIPLIPRSIDSPIKIIDINRRVVYQLPLEGNVIGWVQDSFIANQK